MTDTQKALSKIEEWAEKLPYVSIKFEVQLPDKRYVLEKTRQRRIGFASHINDEGKGDTDVTV